MEWIHRGWYRQSEVLEQPECLMTKHNFSTMAKSSQEPQQVRSPFLLNYIWFSFQGCINRVYQMRLDTTFTCIQNDPLYISIFAIIHHGTCTLHNVWQTLVGWINTRVDQYTGWISEIIPRFHKYHSFFLWTYYPPMIYEGVSCTTPLAIVENIHICCIEHFVRHPTMH